MTSRAYRRRVDLTPERLAPLLVVLLVLLAALLVVLAARSGWRRGASRPVLALLGVAGGAVTGVEVAARVQAHWPQTGGDAVVLVVGAVLVLAVVGASLGAAVGAGLARVLGAVHLGVLDRVAGAVVRGGLAVVLCAVLLPLLPLVPGHGTPGDGLRQSLEQVGRHVLDPVVTAVGATLGGPAAGPGPR